MKNTFSISLNIFLVVLVFSNCENSTKKTSKDNTNSLSQQDYLKEGKEIAMAAKAILGKNLITAIEAGGTAGALAFCNERALLLTDSTSNALDAKMERVSDRNRNSANAASKSELAYIHQAKQDVIRSGSAEPMLREINKEMVGYYPIMTNALSLKCHGDPNKDIDDETLSLIKDKYPNDKAVGYLPNKLRGMWVITMDKIGL